MRVATRRLLRYVYSRVIKFWIFQLASSCVFIVLFAEVWRWSGMQAVSIRDAVTYSWALLPVLAITSAIPLLGATSTLSRYTTFDKLSELFAQVSTVCEKHAGRLREHPRDLACTRFG
jgi:hypothetical protein